MRAVLPFLPDFPEYPVHLLAAKQTVKKAFYLVRQRIRRLPGEYFHTPDTLIIAVPAGIRIRGQTQMFPPVSVLAAVIRTAENVSIHIILGEFQMLFYFGIVVGKFAQDHIIVIRPEAIHGEGIVIRVIR